MDDADKFGDRASECHDRMNESAGFSGELFAIDVAADRDESGV